MIFLKKERPDAKTSYYGSLPARIRNGWNNPSAGRSPTNKNNPNPKPIQGSWRNMRTRNKIEKDKENHFNITGGEYNTVEKDFQNHENAEQQEERQNKKAGGGPIGTEAMIEQHLERNAKIFKYPPQGYWTRIELSILYSMILEPTIFPASAVCEHIQESQQEFDDSANSEPKDSQQPQHFMEPYLYERPPPGQYTEKMTVSYRQFVALLVLAGEEWPAESRVPQALCQSVVQCIVQYADRHGLDRQVELEDGLRKPLESYSRRRGAKITLSSMWPVYLGAIGMAVTGTALPLGLSYIASFALNEKHVQKESVAEENRMQYQQSMKRAARPEQESLLHEQQDVPPIYYYQEDEEEIQLWDDDDKKKEQKKENTKLFHDDLGEDDQYGFVAQELKQHQPKAPTSALAGAGSMLLLGNSIRAQQEEMKKPASYIKASSSSSPMEVKTAYSDEEEDDDDLL